MKGIAYNFSFRFVLFKSKNEDTVGMIIQTVRDLNLRVK
jgi:hypothetical protein